MAASNLVTEHVHHTHGHTDTQTHGNRQTDMHRHRMTDRHIRTHRHRHIETDRHAQTDRYTQTHRHPQIHRDAYRPTQRHTYRHMRACAHCRYNNRWAKTGFGCLSDSAELPLSERVLYPSCPSVSAQVPYHTRATWVRGP